MKKLALALCCLLLAVCMHAKIYTVDADISLADNNLGELVETGGMREELSPPTNLTATVDGNNVHLNWIAPIGSPPLEPVFYDGFEDYEDFALTFDPWITVDVDQNFTYGFVETDWPNTTMPQAFIIFNPSATTPPIADLNAHGGSKMAACFSSIGGPNNDWLISPILQPEDGYHLFFWARSYTEMYGLERFRVGISNGGTAPSDFHFISGGNYVTASAAWTLYSYDLGAYAGQEIRVGIQCVSDDAFIFLVDDVMMGVPSSSYQNPHAGIPVSGTATAINRDLLGYKVYRNSVLVDTIEDPGILAYDDLDLEGGSYSYTVTALYPDGESEPAGPAIATISHVFDPPTNLIAEIEGDNSIQLYWNAPGSKAIHLRYPSHSVQHGEEAPQNSQMLNPTGYKVYRDGILIEAIAHPGTLSYLDIDLLPGTYSYTVTAVYPYGESEPAGPASAVIPADTAPPLNLTAAIRGRDVTLNWESPEAPQQGEWITWCNDVLGNSVGTNSISTFAVAHRYTQNDLANVADGIISQMKFVPSYENCIYTIKVWTGGSASGAGTLVSSQVVSNFIVDEWNSVVLHTPVPIPSTGDVYIGYEVNTQGGYPAGCDDGPPIQGKGNMMCFQGEWDTLTNLAPSLTYNWLIQTFVATDAADMKHIPLTPIVEAPQITNIKADFGVLHKDIASSSRAVAGFKVYRNNVLIATLPDPLITTFSDLEVPDGNYIYGVSTIHTDGESPQTTVEILINLDLGEIIFEDNFEEYQDFAATFAPWTLIDGDLAQTQGINGVDFPDSGSPMAFIIFNPSATAPPINGINAHSGEKMAACFAAVDFRNNDWLITPKLQLGTNSAVRFYARSHTAQYGLERFRVGVSWLPTIIQQGFQWINGEYSEAPTNWTEYLFDLRDYDNQEVFIAIRCVSDEGLVFYVDDFSVHCNVGFDVSADETAIPAISTTLQDNYPNPFNPETTIRYSIKEAGPVSIQIYNIKGQLVNTLVNETKEAGNHSVIWNGKDKNNRIVSSGIYYYMMNAGKYSSIKKMILMK